MNVYRVTAEFIIVGSDWAPEWVSVRVGDKVINDVRVDAVKLVPEKLVPEKPAAKPEQKASNMVVEKGTGRKRKRRRNHQRVNSGGVLVHRYLSSEYLAVAKAAKLGRMSKHNGRTCVWLTDVEGDIVTSAVRDKRAKV